jgi:hypothetical protein
MPNWCKNELFITGDSDAINDFIDKVTLPIELQKERSDTYAILESLYPSPEGVDVLDWQCTHWGAKWADQETFCVGALDNEALFVFDSPWSPPLEGIAFIASMFPTLKFSLCYDEPNMGFYGNTEFYSDGTFEDCCQEAI